MTPTLTDHSLARMIERARQQLLSHGITVHTERWQGVNAANKPEMRTTELLNFFGAVDLRGQDRLAAYRAEVRPNLPWADDHFDERVAGAPFNPGTHYATWPYAGSAEAQLERDGGMYNHNYMERYWPKQAGYLGMPTKTAREWNQGMLGRSWPGSRLGIRHQYGDLQDMVKLLAEEPLTRQAYLPIFFPEDTGKGDGGRKPCTLGYHFMMRENRLHVFYPMRSCDFVRHFRDDIYLTVRLLLWVIGRCQALNPDDWHNVRPGVFSMFTSSLHVFANDWRHVQGDENV